MLAARHGSGLALVTKLRRAGPGLGLGLGVLIRARRGDDPTIEGSTMPFGLSELSEAIGTRVTLASSTSTGSKVSSRIETRVLSQEVREGTSGRTKRSGVRI